MRTTGLKFSFSQVQAPLQITDVTIPGVPPVGVPSGTFRLQCGLGPLIKLNGQVVRTRVSGSFASLLTGLPLRFTACAPVSLSGGGNRVVEPATDAFSVQDVVVNAGLPSAASAAAPTAAGVVSWTSTSRVLRVSAATASYLVVNENFNAGWRAVTGHGQLRAVRLDGWKQAWAPAWHQRPRAPDVPARAAVPPRRGRTGGRRPGHARGRVALARSAAPAKPLAAARARPRRRGTPACGDSHVGPGRRWCWARW